MDIFFISAICLVVISGILLIVRKVSFYVHSISIFRRLLAKDSNVLPQAYVDLVDELVMSLDLLGVSVSDFKRLVLLVYIADYSTAEIELKHHGWITGIMGLTSLCVALYPRSVWLALYLGIVLSLGVIYIFTSSLHILTNIILISRLKYLYHKAKG